MAKVFVSYRRKDSEPITGRLCDRLKQEFGSDQVFVDVDNIPFGEDFIEHIQSTLRQCQIVLVVIGQKWRGRRTKGRCRLDQPDDPVRLELQVALAENLAILPVLVGQASMPAAADLPEELRRLSRLNAAPLDEGRDFHQHTSAIISAIGKIAARPLRIPPQPIAVETPSAVSDGVASEGFVMYHGSSDIEYKCRRCGYTAWIHKFDWYRDGDRPPTQCPKCGGLGYRSETEDS